MPQLCQRLMSIFVLYALAKERILVSRIYAGGALLMVQGHLNPLVKSF